MRRQYLQGQVCENYSDMSRHAVGSGSWIEKWYGTSATFARSLWDAVPRRLERQTVIR